MLPYAYPRGHWPNVTRGPFTAIYAYRWMLASSSPPAWGRGVSSEVGYDVSVGTRVALLRAAAMCPSRRELATSLHMATLGFAAAESGERPPLLVEELGDSVPAQDGVSRRGDSVPVQDGVPRRGPDGRFTISDGGGGGSPTRALFAITGGSGDGRAVAQATIKMIMHNRTPAVACTVGGSGGSNAGGILGAEFDWEIATAIDTGEITLECTPAEVVLEALPPSRRPYTCGPGSIAPGQAWCPRLCWRRKPSTTVGGAPSTSTVGSRPSSQRTAPLSWGTCPSA